VYGIPIPQVDQMPAGMMGAFLAAFKVVRRGESEFSPPAQAMVEFARYRCHLLGLPEDLLPRSARGIFDTMMMYGATLRDGYDDATCGELIRSTMSAYLPPDHSLQNKVFNAVERGFSKVFFTRAFLANDDKGKATQMGVKPGLKDYLLFGAGSLYAVPTMAAFSLAQRLPVINDIADSLLTQRLNQLLADYGHAEYTTDPAKYRDAKAAPAAAEGRY
jgi:hypothetical protein